MAKEKKAPFPAPKRDTSNTRAAKTAKAGKSTKPMKGCKCGGHG